MCVVSMVIQHGMDHLPRDYPWMPTTPAAPPPWIPHHPVLPPARPLPMPGMGPTQAEFEALRRDVQNLTDLVRIALAYDKATNQRECEDPKKVEFLVEIAKQTGVNIDDLIAELRKQ